jgi:hypothetical protein
VNRVHCQRVAGFYGDKNGSKKEAICVMFAWQLFFIADEAAYHAAHGRPYSKQQILDKLAEARGIYTITSP